MDDMEMMENDNIIVLTDEDGVDVEFEFCASVEYEGNEYVVLLPTDDDDGEDRENTEYETWDTRSDFETNNTDETESESDKGGGGNE